MIRPSSALFFAAFIAAGCVGLPKCSGADPRCQELEALHAKYAGTKLTPDQQKLKQKLVAWYHDHCGSDHVAGR
jgi:hypothetical protein